MKNKLLISLLVIAILASISILTVMAAESPTCDEGPIKDVSIKIEGVWYKRPDARIDGLPVTDNSGPFPVQARLVENSGISKVELYYASGGQQPNMVNMTINGNTATGQIPKIKDFSYGERLLHFYLIGYDAEGNTIWIDEIPYSCDPYQGGDPYNFRMYNPHPRSSFIGHWRAVDIDGSNLQLSIAERGRGDYILTLTDDYWSLCEGMPGIGRGTGEFVATDPPTLQSHWEFFCPTLKFSIEYHDDVVYNAENDTLFFQLVTWFRAR